MARSRLKTILITVSSPRKAPNLPTSPDLVLVSHQADVGRGPCVIYGFISRCTYVQSYIHTYWRSDC